VRASKAAAALGLVAVLLAACTFAAEEALPPPTSSFELGYSGEHFAYEELDEYLVTLMEENGWLHGPTARLRQPLSESWMTVLDGRALTGNLNYDGETWGRTPVKAGSDNFLFESRALIGPYLARSEKLEALFYGGFGFRYWHNTIHGPGGYAREVTYYYFPTGLDISGPLTPASRLGFTSEIDFFLYGVVDSHLSDLGGDTQDARNKQPQGVGFRMSAYYLHKLSAKSSICIEPYLIAWTVQESNPDVVRVGGRPTMVVEPENQTMEAGLAVSVKW